MGILFRHIAGRFINVTLLFAVGLVGLIWLIQSLRFIEMIVRHHVHLLDYVRLAMCLVPDLLSHLLPICLFLATLTVLRHMEVHHEIKALQALGVSPKGLFSPFLCLAFVGFLIIFWLNLDLTPRAFRFLKEQEHQLRIRWAPVMPGTFHTFKDMTIYVQSQNDVGLWSHIFIHQPPITLIAQTGQMVQSKDKLGIQLHHGYRIEQKPDGDIHQLSFHELSYDLSPFLKSAHFGERTQKHYEKTMHQLLNPDSSISQAERLRMREELWQRILRPWLALIDVTLACLILNGWLAGICVVSAHLFLVMMGMMSLSFLSPVLIGGFFVWASRRFRLFC